MAYLKENAKRQTRSEVIVIDHVGKEIRTARLCEVGSQAAIEWLRQ